jgi:hypothetical protein
MPQKELIEPMPDHSAEPELVVHGRFRDAGGGHKGFGNVTLPRLADGQHRAH